MIHAVRPPQDDQGRSYSNRNSEFSDSHNVTFQDCVVGKVLLGHPESMLSGEPQAVV